MLPAVTYKLHDKFDESAQASRLMLHRLKKHENRKLQYGVGLKERRQSSAFDIVERYIVRQQSDARAVKSCVPEDRRAV